VCGRPPAFFRRHRRPATLKQCAETALTTSPSERPRVSKVLALLLPALLILSACGGDGKDGGSGQPEALASITVTEADEGKAPEVTFEAPITADEPTIRVLETGDGEEVADGDTATVRLVALNPEDGSVLGETYTAPEGEDIAVNTSLKEGNEQMYNALLGAPVGSQFAYYMPASGAAGMSAQLLVFNIAGTRTVPTRAWGEDVAPVDGLPQVALDEESGQPDIDVPKKKAPSKLVVQELKTGDGATVEADDTVTIQYHGVKWSDGKVFDSSWKAGSPATFPLSNLIEAWKKGLAGRKVGSQILIVAPPAVAYGSSKGHELEKETLVFVVDILDTK
jgi:hypothetical protein